MATSRLERIVRNRIFQASSVLFLSFVVIAFLFSLFGFGKPAVSVVVALDLSPSTQGAVLTQEVQAVKAYLGENSKLKVPNQIQVIGFADMSQALTNSFQTDSQQIETELNKALADLPLIRKNIGGGTEVSQALKFGIESLSQVFGNCKELLLVTDGKFVISNNLINEIASASSQKVKINIVIAGEGLQEFTSIESAFASVGKVTSLKNYGDLQTFFTDNFFVNVNSNKRWINFWLGAAAIALMYVLILPLDEFVFQAMMKMNFTDSGRIVYFITGLSTIVIPLVVFGWSGLPFITECN